MPKFSVGDTVVGNKKARFYSITKEGWIGTVKKVRGEFSIDVEGRNPSGRLREYLVDGKCFDLLFPFKLENE